MCKVVNISDGKEPCKCCKKETRRYIHMRYKTDLEFCWDCYRDAFIAHNYTETKPCPDDLKPHDKTWRLNWKDMIEELRKDYPITKGFRVFEQETFVTREFNYGYPEGIPKWKTKEEEKLFIDDLKNKEVKKCFVYIIGCIDPEECYECGKKVGKECYESDMIYPIVAGKTNVSDPDLSFTDFKESGGNNGTARYLLKCKNLKWHYKSIIVIPCPDKCDKSATTIEREIQMKYRLFGS